MSNIQLKATYASPDSTELFTGDLSSLSRDEKSQKVEEKTAYLHELRSKITQMQSDVNASLTRRMEEDKANATTQSSSKRRTQEQKEEEMYGEEDPDQD